MHISSGMTSYFVFHSFRPVPSFPSPTFFGPALARCTHTHSRSHRGKGKDKGKVLTQYRDQLGYQEADSDVVIVSVAAQSGLC